MRLDPGGDAGFRPTPFGRRLPAAMVTYSSWPGRSFRGLKTVGQRGDRVMRDAPVDARHAVSMPIRVSPLPTDRTRTSLPWAAAIWGPSGRQGELSSGMAESGTAVSGKSGCSDLHCLLVFFGFARQPLSKDRRFPGLNAREGPRQWPSGPCATRIPSRLSASDARACLAPSNRRPGPRLPTAAPVIRPPAVNRQIAAAIRVRRIAFSYCFGFTGNGCHR